MEPFPAQQNNDKKKTQKKKTADQKLIELAKTNQFYYDNLDRCYAKISGVGKLVDIESGEFGGWLSATYFAQYNELPTASKFKILNLFLHNYAKHNGTEIAVHNRVGYDKDAIWLDLVDRSNHAVKITKDGWDMIANPPVYFKKFGHMQQLPIPKKGGKFEELLPFFNITNDEDIVLLFSWIVVSLIPNIQKPFFWLIGEKGTGKTTVAKLVRLLIDPVEGGGLLLGKKPMEVAQQLDHNYLPFFDNFSTISNAVSDLFCLGYSNGNASKRGLFTNADDYHFKLSGSALFACLNLPRIRADFYERSIGITLEKMDTSTRREDMLMMEAFFELRPRIFGALLDVLSKTMEVKPSIHIDRLYRIADFQVWGAAASEAIGFGKDAFLSALERIHENSKEPMPENGILIDEIRQFMNDKQYWEGYPIELLGFIKASSSNIKLLPKDASSLGKKIRKVLPNLKGIGIEIDIRSYSDSKGKLYRIWNHNTPVLSNQNNVQNELDESSIAEAISAIIEDKESETKSSNSYNGLRIEPSGIESHV
jgi:ABC-type oligopeptide transport system ATPase subunit